MIETEAVEPLHDDTLAQMLVRTSARHPDRELFGVKSAAGAFTWMRYGEFARAVADVRGGLKALGVAAGDSVAIIAGNSPEWAIVAYASYGLGAVVVPMYESQSRADWEYIVRDSGARVLFVHREELRARVSDFVGAIPSLRYVMALSRDNAQASGLHQLLTAGRAHPVPLEAVKPDEPMGMIYTSGTTGQPKGVVLSHRNVITAATAAVRALGITKEDRSLSFLPWAHVFGQLVDLHVPILAGASVAFNESLAMLMKNLSEVQPTRFYSVPRIFGRIYGEISQKLRDSGSRAALEQALAIAARIQAGGVVSDAEARELSDFRQKLGPLVQAVFGSRLTLAVSGGSALSADVRTFFEAAGLPLSEGYGLSETTGFTTVNPPDMRRPGSVGKPPAGIRIEIGHGIGDGAEGEIIVHGDTLMLGYHGSPEASRESRTANGGYRTGDLGRIDSDGYLYVTGRIKELYKLQNGKYIAPVPLEEKLKLNPLVANAMVYGDSRPFNIALVSVDMPRVERWAHGMGIAGAGTSLLEVAAVRASIVDELAKLMSGFKGFERPRDFILTADGWELTTDCSRRP